MNGRIRNIQCVVWVTLASLVVMKLDGSSRTPRVELPRVAIPALADTRARAAVNEFAGGAQFTGFEITDAMRDSIVKIARGQLGRRYRLGGVSPARGFDCSGLIRYVLGELNLSLPRLAAQQARVGEPIARERLRPGDLLSFGVGDSVTHIGIYVGDGKYVHASSVAGRVIVSPLDRGSSRLIKPLNGARRLYALSEKRSRF